MLKRNSHAFAALLLIAILGASIIPATLFADNGKGKGKGDDKKEQVEKKKEEKREKKQERKDSRQSNDDNRSNNSCIRAFGHLFAPGWLKKNQDTIEWSSRCFLPFGIAKKFRGVATSTVDTVAPVISNIVVNPNTLSANVSWHTNEKTTGTLYWGTSSNLDINSSSTLRVTSLDKKQSHSVTLSGLNASTTYYFVVKSVDLSGNSTTSSESSFKTKALPTDATPPVISNVITLVGTSTINVNWNTNENSNSKVFYGTSSNVDVNATSTGFVENTSLVQNHSIAISGLATSTTYFMVVQSKDASGNTTSTPVFSATTSSL